MNQIHAPRRPTRGPALTATLAVGLLLLVYSVAAGAAGGDDDASAATTRLLAVELAPDVQEAAGIETRTLGTVRRSPETAASGRVLSLQPLLTQQSELQSANANADAARAALDASSDNYARLRTLHGENANISGRALAQARSAQRTDAAHVAAAEAKMHAIEASARLRWGRPVAQWIGADKPSAVWQSIVAGEEALALLQLRPHTPLPNGVGQVFVATGSDRADARAAIVVGPASADRPATGETWLLRLAADGLRAGMRLRAWVPQADTAQTGVVVPESAIIWQAGRPWAYVRTAPDRFARRPLPDTPNGGSRFVTSVFFAGDAVVIRGAQLLLAEELRAQIPEEDDD